jgi:hypothetical protein
VNRVHRVLRQCLSKHQQLETSYPPTHTATHTPPLVTPRGAPTCPIPTSVVSTQRMPGTVRPFTCCTHSRIHGVARSSIVRGYSCHFYVSIFEALSTTDTSAASVTLCLLHEAKTAAYCQPAAVELHKSFYPICPSVTSQRSVVISHIKSPSNVHPLKRRAVFGQQQQQQFDRVVETICM